MRTVYLTGVLPLLSLFRFTWRYHILLYLIPSAVCTYISLLSLSHANHVICPRLLSSKERSFIADIWVRSLESRFPSVFFLGLLSYLHNTPSTIIPLAAFVIQSHCAYIPPPVHSFMPVTFPLDFIPHSGGGGDYLSASVSILFNPVYIIIGIAMNDFSLRGNRAHNGHGAFSAAIRFASC